MKVLISGGGTGGHIYPAVALIRHLKKHNENVECQYIGTENGLESRIIRDEGIPFKTVTITGFKRKLSLENVKTIGRFLQAVRQSKKYITDFQPDVVIGTGGYVCGPVVYAAAKKKIPTLIHEQNSVPGLTNKFLAKYVSKIALSFPDSATFFPKEKVAITGNPRASEVVTTEVAMGKQKLKELGLSPQKKTVLVVGGSRGAKPINDAVMETLQQWQTKDYQCLYVTGEAHYEQVKTTVDQENDSKHLVIVPYISDMPSLLHEVDLLIARAGATTLAEITALGLPSILIPSPYVTNNHQEKNARSLEKAGAATVILEKEMSPKRLIAEIDNILMNPLALESMKKHALTLGKPHASTELETLIKDLIKGGA
ncbi:undecaprenyldiphospho-muramoylpentapeptide beta-N-acetylglucosaminyltransferase [Salipaludibacillus sp. LMS25]|jgi:UDP-N-acetylglucosamine--N-acetylmuramyl-(pentapeptide) pyrophosphoryl-undecaprenol N-acetylglucosamine transferase|uniref:undecaprenyldiphospho-muramoylpentapeptide beta-N-acetylglucosaminyltransferase n=1 Tax=Salipaludibacillus sp. LMS25 TaxID=2924031 RepID=UPI0020D10A4E|nr:undecaprenyldiphospho-muramoylpentapeptide beta-N-acetylglucosaminyltransferase [Salipaludibacillus sp. LMS25]UTR15187.1 undecaprenyldiphospho-muramoylpentapeptide beta-N-acetylglucosaminyltransferase [Salipaludibacillus sp. LMS25]